jgi:hypothetical protein
MYNTFMSRPKTKEELLKASLEEFEKLLLLIKPLSETAILKPGACEQWSIKDILAHLYAWHNLFMTWYKVGMAGEKPQMPAPGYTWKTTPALNESIYQKFMDASLNEVLENFKKSHSKVLEIINSHTDEELFTKNVTLGLVPHHWVLTLFPAPPAIMIGQTAIMIGQTS